MIFFTIANLNYIDKVTVLASSVKSQYSNNEFVWIVAEKKTVLSKLRVENVDKLISIEDLQIPEFDHWIFEHTVVEACTAVKADAFIYLLKHTASDQIIYLDPDMQVFSKFEELEKLLDDFEIVVTPHLTSPEKTETGVLFNEMDALKHGVFNLGFLAVRRGQNSETFLTWWQRRLQDYCFDEKDRGIFTDQKWINLAIGFFDFIYILRLPNYNLATWNLSNRDVTFTDEKYYVNNLPLRLVHFSGFDSGSHHGMMELFSGSKSSFKKLSENYQKKLSAAQKPVNQPDWSWDRLNSGEKIRPEWRRHYRDSLRKTYPQNPFALVPDSFSEKDNMPKVPLAILAMESRLKPNIIDSFIYKFADLKSFIDKYVINEKKIIVSFTHGLGGGVDLAEKRINNELDASFNIITISNHGRHDEKFLLKISLRNDLSEVSVVFPKNIVTELLNSFKIKIKYYLFHHALNLENYIKEIVKNTDVPYFVFIHDYYFFNPGWSTVGTPQQLGSLPMTQAEHRELSLQEDYQDLLMRWGAPLSWQNFLSQAERILVPSETVRQQLLAFKELTNEITFFTMPDHGDEIEDESVVQKNSKIRICVLGDIGPHKGLNVIREVLNHPRSNNFDFVCLGKTIEDFDFSRQIHNYTPDDYLEKLDQLSPDIIWLPNQVEETYSFTLSEALTFNCLIIASDIKVFMERGLYYKRVLISPKDCSSAEWIDLFENAFKLYSKRIDSDRFVPHLQNNSIKIIEII